MTNTTWTTPPLFAAEMPPIDAKFKRAVRSHYADMADLPLYADKPSGAWHSAAWQSDSGGYGGTTMRDAIQLARTGWIEGADRARALHDAMETVVPLRRKLGAYAVAGAVPSIPRFLSGNPAHMRTFHMTETAQRPVVTLCCGTSVGWATMPVEMLDNATAIAGVVDFLEAGGFRCEVLAYAGGLSLSGDDFMMETVVRLKAADQQLNLPVLVYGLGHVAYQRRLIFGHWMAAKAIEPIGDSLGRPFRAEPDPALGAFHLRSADGFKGDAAARFTAMLDTLRKQGCPGIPDAA